MRAIQDLIGPSNHCHGCGPENSKGYRLKTFVEGDSFVSRFRPEPHHCAGSTEIVNGGVLAALIDCHCVNSAMAHEYQRAGREVGSEPKIWCVTGQLNVRYSKPTPMGKELVLTAKIDKTEGKKTFVSCSVAVDGVPTVTAEVLAIRIERI